MAVKPLNRRLRCPIGTWIDVPDYERFHEIAVANGVTIAAFLRAMVVDVLAEEDDKRALSVESLNSSVPISCQPEYL